VIKIQGIERSNVESEADHYLVGAVKVSDPRNQLQSLFADANRFPNFGCLLIEMTIYGIRCHCNTKIIFESPITAFSGLNGTGKSTILQLAAAAYRPPSDLPFNISDFIVVSSLDPRPFSDEAKVAFRFCQEGQMSRQLTLSYRKQTTRWTGYSRRLPRNVFFAGIATYLPKCEQPSFVSRARNLTVTESKKIEGRVTEWTSRVLGYSYDALISNILKVKTRREKQIVSASRSGAIYSEAHMGFGEARTIHLINTLESMPDKSLVLIEEPETSLHLSAQHEFGRYLVDVCIHKRHQILLTTHSEFLLQALPSASRIYLQRNANEVEPIHGLTAIEARSLMSLGHVKALTILVEDGCAKAILTEIVRRHDPTFLQSLHICVGGDKDRVRNTVQGLKQTFIVIAAVRDGDKQDCPAENIFKLPGTRPPEKELFGSPEVSVYVVDTYFLCLADFATELSGIDHHYWCGRLADRLGLSEDYLIGEMSRVYARSLPESDTLTLITLLKEATRR